MQLRHQSSNGRTRFAFTDRDGGVGAAPFDRLNLGGHVGDDPGVVAGNRRLVAAAVGLPLEQVLYMNQVHGREVAVVDGPWQGQAPEVDAMVTRRPGLALAVLVADCVPVVLADPGAGVVAVAHAGRPGLAAGVVPAVVDVMRDLGAREILARVGPAVCGDCYEVPETMRADVAAVVPQSWSTTRAGTPGLDVPAGVLAQLDKAGVVADRVATCTIEDPSVFSYRRDHTTGRFAGLAWMTPA